MGFVYDYHSRACQMRYIGIDPGQKGAYVIMRLPDVLLSYTFPKDDVTYENGCPRQSDVGTREERIHKWWKQQSREAGLVTFIEQIPLWAGAARFSKAQMLGSVVGKLYGDYKFHLAMAMTYSSKVVQYQPYHWQRLVGRTNTEKLPSNKWKKDLMWYANNIMIPKFGQVKYNLEDCDAALILLAGVSQIAPSVKYGLVI